MRRLGSLLMGLGAVVGCSVGTAMLLHLHLNGLSFLLAVGLGKFTLLASGGLMAGGAFLHRIANRDEVLRLERSVDDSGGL